MGIDALARRCAESGVVLDLRRISTFRHTLINVRNPDAQIVRRVYDNCKIAHVWRCYTIYDGRFYKCSPAPFMERRLALRGVVVDNREDGVSLEGNPDLRQQLDDYLRSTHPLPACSYCLGTSGLEFPFRQLNKQERLEAIKREEGPLETTRFSP